MSKRNRLCLEREGRCVASEVLQPSTSPRITQGLYGCEGETLIRAVHWCWRRKVESGAVRLQECTPEGTVAQ
jgi:hypothetical protein